MLLEFQDLNASQPRLARRDQPRLVVSVSPAVWVDLALSICVVRIIRGARWIRVIRVPLYRDQRLVGV